MTPDPVKTALWLYTQFLDASEDDIVASARQLLAVIAVMHCDDQELYRPAARLLRQDAIRKELEKDL